MRSGKQSIYPLLVILLLSCIVQGCGGGLAKGDKPATYTGEVGRFRVQLEELKRASSIELGNGQEAKSQLPDTEIVFVKLHIKNTGTEALGAGINGFALVDEQGEIYELWDEAAILSGNPLVMTITVKPGNEIDVTGLCGVPASAKLDRLSYSGTDLISLK